MFWKYKQHSFSLYFYLQWVVYLFLFLHLQQFLLCTCDKENVHQLIALVVQDITTEQQNEIHDNSILYILKNNLITERKNPQYPVLINIDYKYFFSRTCPAFFLMFFKQKIKSCEYALCTSIHIY